MKQDQTGEKSPVLILHKFKTKSLCILTNGNFQKTIDFFAVLVYTNNRG